MGDAPLPAVAGPIEPEWSEDALADLNRFEAFLEKHHPELSAVIADAIIAQAQLLAHHPKLGRPIAGRDEYRQLVLRVMRGAYVFQYRYDRSRLVILRVFHAHEER